MALKHFENIKDVHAWTAAHLDVPYEERTHIWNNDLYNLVPLCCYEAVTVVAGQDGRPFIAAKLCSGDIPDITGKYKDERETGGATGPQNLPETVMDFPRLARLCAEKEFGMAIMTDGAALNPKALLHFGCLWSYCAFRYLGGPPMMVQSYTTLMKDGGEDPMNRRISDAGTVSFGFPSEEILPPYVRTLIVNELKTAIPGCTPGFILKSEDSYAMPHRIAIQGVAAEPETIHETGRRLLWYMPPYFPLEIL